jgi:hypothetical protein
MARPDAQHPIALLPTAQLQLIFDPMRSRSWHAVASTPMGVPDGYAGPEPEPAPARVRAPPPRAMSSLTASAVTRTFKPLTQEQVNAIQRVIQEKQTGPAAGGFGTFVSGMVKSAVAPMDVSFAWVKKHGLTVRDLVVSARVPMTDLFVANIVRSFDDLLELGFKTVDLTANPQCFTSAHLRQFFNVTYAHLRDCSACGGLTLSTLLVASPPFTADDLATLGVTARDLLAGADGQIAPSVEYPVLQTVPFTMDDWLALGLDAQTLIDLKLTAMGAKRHLRWDPAVVQRSFGLPVEWLGA